MVPCDGELAISVPVAQGAAGMPEEGPPGEPEAAATGPPRPVPGSLPLCDPARPCGRSAHSESPQADAPGRQTSVAGPGTGFAPCGIGFFRPDDCGTLPRLIPWMQNQRCP